MSEETIRLVPNGQYKSGVFLKLSNGRERLVGTYDLYRGTYMTERKFSKHVFKKLMAWGIAEAVLRFLPSLKKVVVRDVEKRKAYEASIETIREHGSVLHFKKQGFETQRFLPLVFWKETELGTV